MSTRQTPPVPARGTDLRVRRTHPGTAGTLDGARYEVTTPSGARFTVAKVFYAAGPSLFVWEVTGPGTEREFTTKRAALAWLRDHAPAEPGQGH